MIIPGQTKPTDIPAAQFGAPRANGRIHAGVDFYAPKGTPVSLPVRAQVVRAPYEFYRGSYAIDVLVMNNAWLLRICEITKSDLQEGAGIMPDTVIGYTAEMEGIAQCMVHLEVYDYHVLFKAGYKPGMSLTDTQQPYFMRRLGVINPAGILPLLRQ